MQDNIVHVVFCIFALVNLPVNDLLIIFEGTILTKLFGTEVIGEKYKNVTYN